MRLEQLTSRKMSDKLVALYRERRRHYRISQTAFKLGAGKERLRKAYVSDVATHLREQGFVLIDLSNEHGFFAVEKQRLYERYDDASDRIRPTRWILTGTDEPENIT